MNMASAKPKRLRYSKSTVKPLVSQVNLRNMLSRAAVNSLRDMVFPCGTPLLVLLSLCRWAVIELLV